MTTPAGPIVTRDHTLDTLARMRPALFINTFLQRLGTEGDSILTRLFTIATSPAVPEAVQLKAIAMILDMTNAKDVLAAAMGLKRARGRPGTEEDVEAQRQAEEWGGVLDLIPQPDGSFAEGGETPDAQQP